MAFAERLVVRCETVAQFAITYVGPMQEIFATEAIPLVDGLLIVGVGVALLAIIEIEKQLRRYKRRLTDRHEQAQHAVAEEEAAYTIFAADEPAALQALAAAADVRDVGERDHEAHRERSRRKCQQEDRQCRGPQPRPPPLAHRPRPCA